VLEGLAALHVEATFPGLSVPPWAVTFTAPSGWEKELQHVANLHGFAQYSDLITNVFGHRESVGDVRPPKPESMDAETLAYAIEVIRPLSPSNDPRVIASSMYGDTLVAPQGHPTVGMHAFAGFEVAWQWMKKSPRLKECTLLKALTEPTATFGEVS
jgi:hypothetical protein